MKKFLFTTLLLTSCCLANPKIPVTIEKIFDGDTVLARIENHEAFSIRLRGIDCFETSKIHRAYTQAYKNNLTIEEVVKKGKESKKYLEKLYKNSNKTASFELIEQDKYKRNIGILYFDNLNVNEEMLKNGGCMLYYYKK